MVERKPIFIRRAPSWPEKNVTMLVALVERSSQELCDLYRKAANLDLKSVLEGGHNNHSRVHERILDSYILYCSCVGGRKKQI